MGWAIAVHGGAGVDPDLPLHRQEEAKRLLSRCLQIGVSALCSSRPAIDVVELVVRHHPPLTPLPNFRIPMPWEPASDHAICTVLLHRCKMKPLNVFDCLGAGQRT